MPTQRQWSGIGFLKKHPHFDLICFSSIRLRRIEAGVIEEHESTKEGHRDEHGQR
jgi:hypothetical protein